jgi:hypothetical protein
MANTGSPTPIGAALPDSSIAPSHRDAMKSSSGGNLIIEEGARHSLRRLLKSREISTL